MHLRFKGLFTLLSAAVFLSAAAPLAGCNLILGIEEADYDPDERPIGSSGGTFGDGDGDEPFVKSRLPGWSEGLWFGPDTCSEDIDVPEEFIVGAMLRVSCDPLTDGTSISTYITYRLQEEWPRENCSLNATTCDEVYDCIHREPLEADSTLCDEGDLWVCDGNDAVHCSGYPYRNDCSALGATCSPHQNETYAYALGCTPTESSAEEPIDCSFAIDEWNYCSGTSIYTCVDGAAQGRDCAAQGEVCIENVPGEAYCGAEPATCEDFLTSMCVDGELQLCDIDNFQWTYDCAAGGLVCESTYIDEGYCWAAGCETAPPCEELCVDDNTIQICVGGAAVHLDCTAYGMPGCSDATLTSGERFVDCGSL